MPAAAARASHTSVQEASLLASLGRTSSRLGSLSGSGAGSMSAVYCVSRPSMFALTPVRSVGVVGGGRDVHARHAVAPSAARRARGGGVVVEQVLQRRQPVAIERLGKVVLLRVLAVRAFLEEDELGAAARHAQALSVWSWVHVQGGLRRLRKVVGLVPAVGVHRSR